jgi:hypothetical protein
VHGALFPPEQLPCWPGAAKDSFIVCITAGLSDDAIARPFRPHMGI